MYQEICPLRLLVARQSRRAVVAALRESGDLDGEPKPTQRKANFYERGEKPLEIVTSRQWYIRNGGRDEDVREAMLARGKELYQEASNRAYQDRQSSVSHSHPPPSPP